MSTAVRFWRDRVIPWVPQVSILRPGRAFLYAAIILYTLPLFSQTSDAIATANQKKAHQILATTIQALGGPAWLNLRTIRTKGRTAAFFQGDPTGVMAETTETTALPDKQRIDLASKGRVVQIYTGRQGWEITYRGKKAIPAGPLAEYLRWRDHSLGVALREWYAATATVLIYDGQTVAGRQLTDTVTLLNGNDDPITIEMDATSHLPVRLSFSWRDPQFRDKNLDAVEYDNYQNIDGIATPFTVTWTHNGQTVRQRYLQTVQYNVTLPEEFFDPDRAAARLK